jgi:hypothetical protein
MLEKTIKEKYHQVVSYLKKEYLFDINSVIPRAEIYHQYCNDRTRFNLPEVLTYNMGYIVRFAFSRNSGVRTQRKDENGKRVDCYFLRKSWSYIYFNFSFNINLVDFFRKT